MKLDGYLGQCVKCSKGWLIVWEASPSPERLQLLSAGGEMAGLDVIVEPPQDGPRETWTWKCHCGAANNTISDPVPLGYSPN